jgi:hypothetical protein
MVSGVVELTGALVAVGTGDGLVPAVGERVVAVGGRLVAVGVTVAAGEAVGAGGGRAVSLTGGVMAAAMVAVDDGCGVVSAETAQPATTARAASSASLQNLLVACPMRSR